MYTDNHANFCTVQPTGRSPDAAQRVALAKAVRCRAGAVPRSVFVTIPVLRSITPRRAACCIAPGKQSCDFQMGVLPRSRGVMRPRFGGPSRHCEGVERREAPGCLRGILGGGKVTR